MSRYFPQNRAAAPMVGHGCLAQVFVPNDHVRYSNLVEWAKTADVRMWKFGKSSDNRDGIWIAYNVWDDRQVVARKRPAADGKPDFPLALSEITLKVMQEVDEARSWGSGKAAE